MLDAAKAVGNAAGTLADNYKFSKELEAQNTQLLAEGINTWGNIIIKEDVSGLSPEMRKDMHAILDGMSALPVAGAIGNLKSKKIRASR